MSAAAARLGGFIGLGSGVSPWHRAARDSIAVLVAGILVLAILSPGAYDLRILTLTLLFALGGIGLNVLVGYGGIVSVGHAAFLAIGGYSWAVLADDIGALAFLVGIAIAVAVALGVGWMCLRWRGYYLAVATLAVGLLAVVIMRNWESVTGGDAGLRGFAVLDMTPLSRNAEMFVLALVAFCAFLYLQNAFRSSSIGEALLASRFSEEASSSLGISVGQVRVIAFVVSAIPAAVAGALIVQLYQFANPEEFNVRASISLIAIPIIAGRGWSWAPLVGAAVVIALPEYVRFLAEYRLMFYGLVLMGIALFLPGGLREVGAFVGRAVSSRVGWRARDASGAGSSGGGGGGA